MIKLFYNRCVLFFLALVMNSCTKVEESNIVGVYEMDKYVERDSITKVEDYRILDIKTNNTFELRLSKEDLTSKIIGNWKIVKSDKEEASVQFNYLNKEIKSVFRTDIFYFEYPNDFHGSKYNHLLYVKLNK